MSTLSVPLTVELMQGIDELVASGKAANRADAARKALKKYIEDHVVEEILKASKEPRLEGDLDELAAKFK